MGNNTQKILVKIMLSLAIIVICTLIGESLDRDNAAKPFLALLAIAAVVYTWYKPRQKSQ